MSVKLSLFTRLTVKLESPHAFTFLFNKPTALELLTIQSQSFQLQATAESTEERAAFAELCNYETIILKKYCTEVHGLEDDNGVPIVLKLSEDIDKFLDYLPVGILQNLYWKFIIGLNPTPEEKKS